MSTTTAVTPEVMKTLQADGLWKLYFKRGNNPRCEAIFHFNGTKEQAIKRGQEHCFKMNYKFIHVEAFLVDLEKAEKEFDAYNNPAPPPLRAPL